MGDLFTKFGLNIDDRFENRTEMNRDQIMQVNAIEDIGIPFAKEQPTELLPTPWRKYKDLNGKKWTEQNETKLKDDISKFEEKINLLFVGQVQSGKSSTINSLISVQEGEISERTKAGEVDDTLTVHFNVIQGQGILKNIKMCDIFGLELAESQGLQMQELLSAASGRLPVKTDLSLVKVYEPGPEDASKQIHCVVYIVDGENATMEISSGLKRKIAVIEKALKAGPNRVVFVTKIDKICPAVKEDITNIFYSPKVLDAVKNASKLVGVPVNKVFPVHNYTDEVEVDTFTNVPLLLALKAAIKMGSDYIKGQELDNK